MNVFCRFLLAGLLCVPMAGTALAQIRVRATPQMRGYWKPVVGGGSAYEITSPEGQKSQMEVAIVGKDSAGGKDAFWMEMTMANPRVSGDMIIKDLVTLDGSQMTVSKFIMQMPGQAPMLMPDSMTQMQKPLQYDDVHNDAEDVGSESVTVPAGTFQCEHWRMKDGSGDAWASDKVSPFGLVKYQGNKSNTMVLTKVINDAKDKITGTPTPFDPMKMMQQPQPQQ